MVKKIKRTMVVLGFFLVLVIFKNALEACLFAEEVTVIEVIAVVMWGAIVAFLGYLICSIENQTVNSEKSEGSETARRVVYVDDFELQMEEVDIDAMEEELLKPIVIEETMAKLVNRERTVPLTEKQLKEVRECMEEFTTEELETL